MQPARAQLHNATVRGAAGRVHFASAARTHVVQFYENDDYLADTVALFIGDGLEMGQPVVAILGRRHRELIVTRLSLFGVAVESAVSEGRLTFLDSQQCLAAIMSGPMPDATRFRATVRPVLEASQRVGGDATVRVYGEMVDVLCRRNQIAAAIRLEEMWNDLATEQPFTLLCSYALGTFADAEHARSFAEICGSHQHVIPTERYTDAATEDQRHLEISLLEQRAKTLEFEIARREQLERSLRDALAAAESANRAKSDFLAVMSHELRTPLNAIGGHVQLVEMGVYGPVTDLQRQALERAQNNQRHLLALINDLLSFGQLEAGRAEFATEQIYLAPFVEEAVALLEPLLRTAELECTVAIDPHRSVRADREKLHQVLVNLLTNAIKFTPAGGRITIDTPWRGDTSDLVALRVADTGPGIPADMLERVFEPFVQAGVTPIGHRAGVGLGLAISRTLARRMGGTLGAANGEGGGAVLVLALPRG
ncbi:MAG: hypothetical protein NVS1B4_25680 [Gemmatimonadaceae bacterium]